MSKPFLGTGTGTGTKLGTAVSPNVIVTANIISLPTEKYNESIEEELKLNTVLEKTDEMPGSGIEKKVSQQEETFTEFNMDGESARSTDFDDISGESGGYKTSDSHENMFSDLFNDVNESAKNTVDLTSLSTGGSDDTPREYSIIREKNLTEYLMEQVNMMRLSEEEAYIAEYIVYTLNSSGYLPYEIDEIRAQLFSVKGYSTTNGKVYKVLKQIQQLDPVGVGCISLTEFLKLQIEIRIKESKDAHEIKLYNLGAKALEQYKELIETRKNIDLARKLGISTNQLNEVFELLATLDTQPARGFDNSGGVDRFERPDFQVINTDGEMKILLHQDNKPNLKVNETALLLYNELKHKLTKAKRDDPARRDYKRLVEDINKAKVFIDNSQLRYNTLRKVMTAIVNFQWEYFQTGDEQSLKPMILNNIADITNLDVSTVSRATNDKFVETEFGLLPLRFFFSESITTSEGDEVSTAKVKAILKKHISEENPNRPLSDDKLRELLDEEGYPIARRTVAKYREQLKIPVARLRRSIKAK